MIKLIICDVGGVINTFDESMYINYICGKLGIDDSEFRSVFLPMLDRAEIGKLKIPELERRLSRAFRVNPHKLEWNSAFKRLNRLDMRMVRLLNALSKRYRIAILTNVSRSRHSINMQTQLYKIKYSRVFASCYLGMAKPNPKIYRFVLSQMKTKPDESIFIDNLKSNADGAKKVGINAIQFKSYGQLVKDLKKMGVAIDK